MARCVRVHQCASTWHLRLTRVFAFSDRRCAVQGPVRFCSWVSHSGGGRGGGCACCAGNGCRAADSNALVAVVVALTAWYVASGRASAKYGVESDGTKDMYVTGVSSYACEDVRL